MTITPILALLALALILLVAMRVSRWAKANPDPNYDVEDAAGITNREYSEAIK